MTIVFSYQDWKYTDMNDLWFYIFEFRKVWMFHIRPVYLKPEHKNKGYLWRQTVQTESQKKNVFKISINQIDTLVISCLDFCVFHKIFDTLVVSYLDVCAFRKIFVFFHSLLHDSVCCDPWLITVNYSKLLYLTAK